MRFRRSEAPVLAARYYRHLVAAPPEHGRMGSGGAAAYLQQQLALSGVSAAVSEHHPGRANLVAQLPAAAPQAEGDGALLLAAPLDSPDPSGCGPGPAAVFTALLAAAARRADLGLRRDVILALTTEGPAHSDHSGLAWLAGGHLSAVKAAGALTAGGWPLRLMGKSYITYVHAGFGRAVLRVAAREQAAAGVSGRRGHGVAADHPIILLAKSLAALEQWQCPVHVTPSFQQCVEALAAPLAPPDSVFVRSLMNPLMTREAAVRVAGDPETRSRIVAQSVNTFEPVGLSAVCGGDGRTTCAEATILCRLLPGQTAAAARGELEELLMAQRLRLNAREGCCLEITVSDETPACESPPHSELTWTMRRALHRRRPAVALVPVMDECDNGVRALRSAGIPVYGFFPLVRSPENREALPPGALELAASVLWDVVTGYAGAAVTGTPDGGAPGRQRS